MEGALETRHTSQNTTGISSTFSIYLSVLTSVSRADPEMKEGEGPSYFSEMV